MVWLKNGEWTGAEYTSDIGYPAPLRGRGEPDLYSSLDPFDDRPYNELWSLLSYAFYSPFMEPAPALNRDELLAEMAGLVYS